MILIQLAGTTSVSYTHLVSVKMVSSGQNCWRVPVMSAVPTSFTEYSGLPISYSCWWLTQTQDSLVYYRLLALYGKTFLVSSDFDSIRYYNCLLYTSKVLITWLFLKSYTMNFPAIVNSICALSVHSKRTESRCDNFPASFSSSTLLICSRVITIVSFPVLGWICLLYTSGLWWNNGR